MQDSASPRSCRIGGVGPGRPQPVEPRSRVIAFVGTGRRKAARDFRLSPCFVNDGAILKCQGSGLPAKGQADSVWGKRASFAKRGADLTLHGTDGKMVPLRGAAVPCAPVATRLIGHAPFRPPAQPKVHRRPRP